MFILPFVIFKFLFLKGHLKSSELSKLRFAPDFRLVVCEFGEKHSNLIPLPLLSG
jgi:hypothetical protein